MNRAERAKEAADLRGQGLKYREIAKRMDLSKSYVHELCKDPEGSVVRARKDSYRGVCKDCGGPTDGSHGRSGRPTRCAACAATHFSLEKAEAGGRGASLTYTNGDLLNALCAAEGTGTLTKGQYGAHRAKHGGPSTPVVVGRFGTWNEAVAAAGLEATTPCRDNYPHRRDPVKAVLRVAKALGRLPSYRTYENYRLDHPDANLPSGSLIRTQIRSRGEVWVDVLRVVDAQLKQAA